jgi:WD40 repeat protein
MTGAVEVSSSADNAPVLSAAAAVDEAHASAPREQPLRPDAFVSYSRADEEFVRKLTAALAERGKDVWVDWDDIPPTADWRARIDAGIEVARSFVAVLSPQLVASDVCRDELRHAAESNKRIVPILRREVDRQGVPPELLAPNWIFFRESDDFERSVDALVDALETDLEWLEAHARLLIRAVEWERGRRDGSLLLRGRDLRDAEAWLAAQGSHREPATPLQTDFILASRKAAGRRLRVLLGGVLLALAAAVVLGLVALFQRDDAIEQATISRSRELAASALTQLTSDPELSLLLAREAVEERDTPQARVALQRSLRASRLRLTVGDGDGPVSTPSFSLDGSRILNVAKGAAWIRDARTGVVVHDLRVDGAQVTLARFSSDGARVVTAGGGQAPRVWDAASGDLVATLRGHRGAVKDARFSPGGRLVLTRGSDRRTGLFQAATGKPIAFLPSTADVTGAAFSPDGRRIATTSTDRLLRVWDGRTGEPVRVIEADYTPSEVGADGEPYAGLSLYEPAFDRSGKLVAAGRLHDARVWDTSSGRLVATLQGHAALDGFGSNAVRTLVFSPDGRMLLTTGEDGTARLWRSGPWTHAILEGHAGALTRAEFSRDSSRVLTVGSDGTARVWDATTGGSIAVLRLAAGTIVDASFSPDGNRIVTATDDGARVWALSGFDQIRRIDGWNAVLSPDGRVVATTRGTPKTPDLRDWVRTTEVRDVATGTVLTRVRTGSARVRSVDWGDASTALSPDGRLAFASSARTAAVWNVRTGRVLSRLRGLSGPIRDAEFSRDGTRVFTMGDQGTARVWLAATGEPLHVYRKPFARPSLGPGGRVVLRDLRGRVSIWDLGSGTTTAVLRGTFDEYFGFAFSRDGTRIFASSSTTNELTGAGFAAVALIADGTLAVTAWTDGTAQVWDATTGEQVAVLTDATAWEGGTKWPTQLSVSRDGEYIATVFRATRIYVCDECRPFPALRRLADERIARTITRRAHERLVRATAGG